MEETRSEESIKGSREDLQRERETLIIKSQATLKDIKAKDDYLVWLKKGFIDLPTTQKAQIAKPLVIILDQKNALEEWLAGLLIDLKRFNIAKGNAVEFAVLREKFKKIEDKTMVFEQNLQTVSNYIGAAHH